MEIKLLELLMTKPALFVAFGFIVFLLTYLLKKPIKHYTARIKDEQKRKLTNKWILLIPFALALLVYFIYHGFVTKEWFSEGELVFSSAFSIAAMAITIYNVFEGLKGKKSVYETDADAIALYNLLLVYAEDKTKVKLLLDQCKENYKEGKFELSETIKGWLPPNVEPETVTTLAKVIKKYLDLKKEEEKLP